MSDDPGTNHYCNTDKAENHPERFLIIRSEDDVIHISRKSGQDHQRHVHGEEREVAEQKKRAACLPPNNRGYRGKRFANAGDIAMPDKIESGPKTKTTAK